MLQKCHLNSQAASCYFQDFLEQEYHSIQNYISNFSQKEALHASVCMLVDVTVILDDGKFKGNGKNTPELSGFMM